jgi:glycosyltransferase involved in cell wall biosynthesis
MRIHLTNITGTGATELVRSLLPAIESLPDLPISCIDIPATGPLSTYRSANFGTMVAVYRRQLPNALSRIFECTIFAKKFWDSDFLLVLGDLPLRVKCSQTVFVQNSHLIRPKRILLNLRYLKYAISRALFSLNMSYCKAFVVQTELMKLGLERSYPDIKGRVHIVAQPVPTWLLQSGLTRISRLKSDQSDLKLIYPSAGYPHKNHTLLSKLDTNDEWPVGELQITLEENYNPASHLPWLRCVGFLSSQGMIQAYSEVDALLFLSKEESYGFPLVEAMFVGLPVVCPDLPYARTLCGDQAFYFDPNSPRSLQNALKGLKLKLDDGWWPCWSKQMESIPKDWESVARCIRSIASRPCV